MAIIVGHPIEGISINGNEYLVDDEGNYLTFCDEKQAREHLHNHGLSDDDIEDYGIVFVKTEQEKE